MAEEMQGPQSPMDMAFMMVAVDACELLRKWSDTDGRIFPARIVEFQQELKQTVASVYFGTHPRLEDVGESHGQ